MRDQSLFRIICYTPFFWCRGRKYLRMSCTYGSQVYVAILQQPPYSEYIILRCLEEIAIQQLGRQL